MKELTYEEVLDQIEHQRRFGNRPGAEVSALMLENECDPYSGDERKRFRLCFFVLNFKGSRDSYRNVYLTAPG